MKASELIKHLEEGGVVLEIREDITYKNYNLTSSVLRHIFDDPNHYQIVSKPIKNVVECYVVGLTDECGGGITMPHHLGFKEWNTLDAEDKVETKKVRITVEEIVEE